MSKRRAPKEVAPPKGFPSEVTIKARQWKIIYCLPDHPMLVESEQDKKIELLGCSCQGERTIYVDASVERQTLIDTLIHEIFHSQLRSSPLNITSDEEEERLVLFATEGFFDIINNCKKFW